MSRAPRRALAAFLALLSTAVACTSGDAAAPPSTTTTTVASALPGDGSTTTSSDAGAVSRAGFRTRREGVLIIGTERLSAPWYTGPSPTEITGGFDYAVAQEIGSRLGVPIVKVVKTSLVLMMTGQDCKCDVMLGAITITDGRARTLDLTEPYAAADQAVLARKGTTLGSVAEARLLRWAVGVRNTAGIGVLADRVKPIDSPSLVVNEDEGIRDLEQGDVDAVMLDLPQALAVAATDPTLTVVGRFSTGAQYAMALSLGSPNTALINDVIRGMRDDGILDALYKTYLGIDPAEVPVIPT